MKTEQEIIAGMKAHNEKVLGKKEVFSNCCGQEMNGHDIDYGICPACHDHCEPEVEKIVYHEKSLIFTANKGELRVYIENQNGNGGAGSETWVNLTFLLNLEGALSDIKADAIIIDDVKVSIHLIRQLIDDLREAK